MKRIILVILLFLLVLLQLPAQLMPLEYTGSEPKPYEEDEFPDWAWKVRRFEVILIGSYPLVYIFTTILYDFAIYAYNEFDEAYNMGTQREQGDLYNMFAISISVSGAIAILDFLIQGVKDRRQVDPYEYE